MEREVHFRSGGMEQERERVRLASYAYEEASRTYGVYEDLQRFKNTLSIVQGVPLDSEEKKDKKHGLHEWLRQIENICYHAEDVLDGFELQNKRKLVVKASGSTRMKVGHFFSSHNPIVFSHRMAHQIKDVRDRLDQVVAEGNRFGLERRIDVHPRLVLQKREMTYSHVDASDVIGRENDKEEIVKLLMQPHPHGDGHGDRSLCVVPIVGIGGLGKTTLAKLVFNDKRMDELFQLKMWVCVSDDFDIRQIVIKIINSASASTSAPNITHGHQENINHLDMEQLAFKNGEEKKYSSLVEIGKEIVEKCQGVPLALRTLGSSLYSNFDLEKFPVRDSELWNLEKKEIGILLALKLSYDEMPSHLRHCFTYFSLFPKDYQFQSYSLKNLWLAHGLLQSQTPSGSQKPDDIIRQYIDKLCSRSFLQDFEEYSHNIYSFKIHDLVHDLVVYVVKEEFVVVNTHTRNIPEQILFNGAQLTSLEKLYVVACGSLESLPLYILPQSQSLWVEDCKRINLSLKHESPMRNSQMVQQSVNHENPIQRLRMKVLQLWDFRQLQTLPQWIEGAGTLQTLIIGDCPNLKMLPECLTTMTHLKILHIGNCPQLRNMVSIGPSLLTSKELKLKNQEKRKRIEVIDLKDKVDHEAGTKGGRGRSKGSNNRGYCLGNKRVMIQVQQERADQWLMALEKMNSSRGFIFSGMGMKNSCL
ncbi:Winged helix-like DNA-binding domain superfamily [Sesbania bispinosa]|nr:Winged helix-like DNA-binding domain superfamily [Sesbania bispinosa]